MKILPCGVAVIENDTHISKWVDESQKLDHDEYSLGIILPYIEESAWVVDGGAFIGDHTIAYLKAVGPSGKVYAFEPNQKAFECLYFNCPQAHTFNSGLSDYSGVVPYSVSENAGAGHLGTGDSQVTVMTLDSLNLGRCDFFKLDVEGHEYQALIGASQTILNHRPVMWIEVNEGALARQSKTPKDLLNLVIEDFKYSVKAFPPEKGPQYDILCTP